MPSSSACCVCSQQDAPAISDGCGDSDDEVGSLDSYDDDGEEDDGEEDDDDEPLPHDGSDFTLW